MSLMADELREAPEAVQRFLDSHGAALARLGARLRQDEPPLVITSARGSSDNAALFFKYLAEIVLGVPCCSIGASVVSVYGAALRAKKALAITISQSGKSPDIVALQDAARRAGALTVALVNVADSPAALAADIALPLCAGPERSVAATKSFIVSAVAGAAIVAHWKNDGELQRAIAGMPEVLRKAADIAWTSFADAATGAGSLYVLGRGPCLPMALETALKLKETCGVHAEAYSLAEVMHGPMELLSDGFPVLAYAPADAAQATGAAALSRLAATGAAVMAVTPGGLPFAATGHPLLDGISMIETAYANIEAIARRRGRDPDRPRLLKKVTETV
jgi:glucosamine--fructose-6-phosphate aminotransferase (isomerizing)